MFCLDGHPEGWLHGPTCTRYGGPAEYIRVKLGNPKAKYAGMGVAHRGELLTLVTLFYCLSN